MRGRPCTECQASLFAKALVAAHPRLETRLLPSGRRSELVREGGTSGATFSLNLTSLSRTSEASPGPLLRPPGQNQKLETARRACSRKRWWRQHPRLETRLLPSGRRSELVREGGTSGATFSLNLTSFREQAKRRPVAPTPSRAESKAGDCQASLFAKALVAATFKSGRRASRTAFPRGA